MIHRQSAASFLRTVLMPAAFMAAGVLTAAAEELAAPPVPAKAARIVTADIGARASRLVLSAPEPGTQAPDAKATSAPDTRSVLVALPRGTTHYTLAIDGPAGCTVAAPEGLMIMRGQPVLRVVATGAGTAPVTVTVSHDGSWAAAAVDDRVASASLASASLAGILGETLPAAARTGGQPGSYLVVCAPAFADAIAPLVDWKTRKGYHVVQVSTAETGSSTDGIKAYIQNAYDTWDLPPEYVLLVGDVAEIPTYSFYGNPSDQPYVQLEGDDWLMDAMVGRLPVENASDAQALVAKTINYERYPDLAGDPTWQTRSLMVAGVYASDTPGYTVNFCGERLQDLGFPVPTAVSSPPLPSLQGAMVVSSTINTGVGMVVYRGWAYGTGGWDPPSFTVDNIPALNTNNKTPIVMSFVCLNGDYTSSSACFGEVFVRQGSPAAPGKGAVAFIGNGEHWSHTRYNDAMAIGIFERIVDSDVTDLGTLLSAGKVRFMDYFPNELSAAEGGEESVEFYFHIYNLLGDPSLKFWRELPRPIDVGHAASLPVGANRLVVTVNATADAAPVAGARVGVVQGGVLIGTGVTGSDGSVDLVLTPVTGDGEVAVTVSEAGTAPYEGSITTSTAAAYVAVTGLGLADGAGNGDQTANPGESIDLTAALFNHGLSATGAFDLGIASVSGPATAVGGTVACASLGAGAAADAAGALGLVVDATAADGDVIAVQFDAVRTGGQHDITTATLTVAAPAWEVVSLAAADGAAPISGATTDLALTLRNTGSVAAAGGSIALSLLTPGGASLGNGTAALPACAPGATVTTDAAFDLAVPGGTATGTNLTFALTVTTTAGARTDTHGAVVVGPVDVTSPVGPDNYGYYAYDSADYDYPASRPTYDWQEISTAFAGPGTKLDFPVENEVVWMVLDLPFTFRFYGQDYTRIRVSDNGWLSFDTGTDYDFYNWTIPTQYGVEAVVAPFWDNLNPVPPGAGEENVNGIDPDGIYVHHDVALGAYIVEWSRLPHYKPEILGLQTFEVLLLDPAIHQTAGGDGEMLFQYRQVNNNDYLRMYATVGIESPDGSDGLQLSYGNINAAGLAPLQPGLAIRVTTEAPVRVPFALAAVNARRSGDSVVIDWEPADQRPVLGWHIDRITGDQRVRLTETPLPAEARGFTAAAAAAGAAADSDNYVVIALQPYGAVSDAGTVGTAPGRTRLMLGGAQPNPAPGAASINFALPRSGTARLRVYDVAGRLVRTLVSGPVAEGPGLATWDGHDDSGAPAAAGVYFYRLEAANEVLTRKLILVR